MRIRSLGVLVSLAVVAAFAVPAGADPSATGQANREKAVCGAPGQPDQVRCHAHVRTKGDGATPLATSGPTGFAPLDLQGAYGAPVTTPITPGSGPIVAIVDAYDNPNAEADLNVYRRTFGLGECTTANGCFTKVVDPGTPTDVGWGQEIDLDIQMVAAICPNCKILLVEARSNSLADLGAAVNIAASRGAVAISNSYGTAREFNGETSYNGPYVHPGIAITASSGDSGYGTSFPAASNTVVAVGGASLTRTSSGWSESAWSGAGSGCSAYFGKPAWQKDAGCKKRTVSDVSAVADPYTGVSVYDSFGSTGGNNWYVFGGTSVSAPIVASFFALGGHAGGSAGYLYSHTSGLRDVVGGRNGGCGRYAYLCNGVTGFDGPTGLGSPNGTSAF